MTAPPPSLRQRRPFHVAVAMTAPPLRDDNAAPPRRCRDSRPLPLQFDVAPSLVTHSDRPPVLPRSSLDARRASRTPVPSLDPSQLNLPRTAAARTHQPSDVTRPDDSPPLPLARSAVSAPRPVGHPPVLLAPSITCSRSSPRRSSAIAPRPVIRSNDSPSQSSSSLVYLPTLSTRPPRLPPSPRVAKSSIVANDLRLRHRSLLSPSTSRIAPARVPSLIKNLVVPSSLRSLSPPPSLSAPRLRPNHPPRDYQLKLHLP